MPAHPLLRLRNPLLLLALASAFPVFSYAAGAARIDFSAGSVTAVSESGAQRALSKGAEIGNGETIRTGDDARAQLRFSDGALVSLQPRTEFRIDNYQYAGQPDGKEKGFFSLLRGGLRTITGWVGRTNRDAYRVKTNVATIGIRGTGYKSTLDESGNELMISTSEGEVEVCNDAGCIILASGENGVVQGANPPQRTNTNPLLSPPSLNLNPNLPGFSDGENRNSDGGYSALGGSMLTGTQTYATAFATKGGLIDTGIGTGTIGSDGLLTSFTYGGGTADAGIPLGNTAQTFGNDGIVAWGRWVENTAPFGSMSSGEGVLHYVTGIPTTDPLASLGATGFYTSIGGGVSGSSSGLGSITGGSMNVNFGTATVTALVVSMSVGSNSYTFGAGSTPISPIASGYGFGGSATVVNASDCSSPCGGTFSGSFFGAGAPRAGVAFKFDASQTVTGSVAFKRN